MKRHESQRGYFAYSLHEQMGKNKDIYLVTGDLGYGMLDAIKQDYPDQFINVGAAEQSMLGVAVGLALEGKTALCYTITSFYLRAAETIHLYLNHEQIPVKLIGSGRGKDYAHDGISHDCTMAQTYLGLMNLEQYYPENKECISDMVQELLTNGKPSFISLTR